MRIINGRVFNGSAFVAKSLYVQDGRFVSAENYSGPEDEVFDAFGSLVAPGLVDSSIMGCVGYDFCEATQEAFESMCSWQASLGVTTLVPSICAPSWEAARQAAVFARSFAPCTQQAGIAGVNLHCPTPLRFEDFKSVYDQVGHFIKLISLRPEEPGAYDFMEQVADYSRVALAKSSADYYSTVAALDCGATVYGLGEETPELLKEEPGPLAAAFEFPQTALQLAASCVQMHPSYMRLLFRIFGAQRMLFASSSIPLTGLPDGEYRSGNSVISLRENVALGPDGKSYGLVCSLARCLSDAVIQMGIPLADALNACSINPARALGLDRDYGSIEPGKVANCLLIDEYGRVEQVILRGEVLEPGEHVCGHGQGDGGCSCGGGQCG